MTHTNAPRLQAAAVTGQMSVEEMLREIAYVMHTTRRLTREVKRSVARRADRPADRDVTTPHIVAAV